MKVFLFVLFSFFFLYALLDYATHMEDFVKKESLQIKDLIQFYLNHFLKRADLLLPLALLVATIKVLTSLNIKHEWMVLQVAGVRARRLLRPFFVVAFACCLFNWLNFQYLLPSSLQSMEEFHIKNFKHSHRAQRQELIHILKLKDRSKLLYQSYDEEKKAFFDVLWIRSVDDIWRIKLLNADPSKPLADYVDHLSRNKEGFLEKTESYERCLLPDLKWNLKMADDGIIPFESLSIKALWKELGKKSAATQYETPKILSQFFFKLAIPFLSVLALLPIIPWCITFSRDLNTFIIYAGGLFGLLAFYMLLDAVVILGEHNVVHPSIAILSPFVICGLIFSRSFLKKTCV
jgi:lipopolysaccharide export system permease protein